MMLALRQNQPENNLRSAPRHRHPEVPVPDHRWRLERGNALHNVLRSVRHRLQVTTAAMVTRRIATEIVLPSLAAVQGVEVDFAGCYGDQGVARVK
jgi:hypothetical protein